MANPRVNLPREATVIGMSSGGSCRFKDSVVNNTITSQSNTTPTATARAYRHHTLQQSRIPTHTTFFTPRHICTTYFQHISPRLISNTYLHDLFSAHNSTTYRHHMRTQVLQLAESDNLEELQKLGNSAIERIENLPEPDEGWSQALPLWCGLGVRRGLESWGARVYTKNPNAPRAWEVDLCAVSVQKALNWYLTNVGLPPVVTGVKAKKRSTRKKSKRYGSGHTRGQKVLARGKNPIDLLTPFILVVHAHYCHHLNPRVEEGTDADDAVLYTITRPQIKKRLLSSVRSIHTRNTPQNTLAIHIITTYHQHIMQHIDSTHTLNTHCNTYLQCIIQIKTRLQRLSNRSLILTCIEPLWNWVRDDPSKPGACETRLEIFRCFGSDKTDAATKKLVEECYRIVIETLLAYAQGTPPTKEGAKQKVFPYVRYTHLYYHSSSYPHSTYYQVRSYACTVQVVFLTGAYFLVCRDLVHHVPVCGDGEGGVGDKTENRILSNDPTMARRSSPGPNSFPEILEKK